MSAEEVAKITASLEQVQTAVAAVGDQQKVLSTSVSELAGSHKPGLCSSEECDPCKTSRKDWGVKVANNARDHVIEELTAACKWAGTLDVLKGVNDIYERWVAADRPEPQEQAFTGLTVEGVRITQ